MTAPSPAERTEPTAPMLSALPAPSEQACPNCGTAAPGPFCSECGQRQGRLRVSLPELARDIAGDVLHVDSKLVRTAVTLVSRPGQLTSEYLQGRRDRYVRPFKVYLIASVAYFSALALHPPTGAVHVKNGGVAIGVTAGPLEISQDGPSPSGPASAAPSVPAGSPAPAAGGETGVFSRFGEALKRKVEKSGEAGLVAELVHAFAVQFPRLMFVLLPIFAALTWLCFRKARLYYVEHFIFALHVHSVTFLAFALERSFDLTPVRVGLDLAAALSTFLAARAVFALGSWGTLWRGLLVGSVYLLAVSAAIVAVLFATVLLA